MTRSVGLTVAAAALVLVVAACSVSAYTTLVTAGSFTNLYNPSAGSVMWYVNDHTLVYGPGGIWSLFGITHTEPADPEFEVNFAHAQSLSLSSQEFMQQPFAMGSLAPETHLWAPYVIFHEGTYYMYYCGGGDDRTRYQIALATSTDLYNWERRGTLFEGGVDGRDPVVLNLGAAHNHTWALYWTGTNPDSTSGTVNHVNYVATSTDLLQWTASTIAFDGGVDGNNFGGPTESPFVVRRGTNFYLFNGAWEGQYALTRCWVSTDPLNFGSTPLGTATQCGEIPSHALEVVRGVAGDNDGGWYVTHAGWGQGGVWLAPITWSDGMSDDDTSLPVPPLQPRQAPGFNAGPLNGWSLSGDGSIGDSPSVFDTPLGLQLANPMANAFYVASNGYPQNPSGLTQYSLAVNLTFVTKDGNPSSTPSNITRDGTAGALLFGIENPTFPLSGQMWAVNLHTDSADGSGAGGKAFQLAPSYEPFGAFAFPALVQGETYTLTVDVSAIGFDVYFSGINDGKTAVMTVRQTYFKPGGYVGLNVWRGSVLFQNLTLQVTN